MPRHLASLAAVLFLVSLAHAQPRDWPRVERDRIPAELRNPWPDDLEREFQERAAHALERIAAKGLGGNGWGENEKQTWARAMTVYLTGDEPAQAKALAKLQEDDPEDIHGHTSGIDFYWCFALKHQTRKFFLLGDKLTPEHRSRMLEGAKSWTAQDPLRREHPQFGRGDRSIKDGWGPQKFGSWVDVRDTDNLRAMRDTSVYLFAEAAGNEQTRLLYKEKIRGWVAMLYHVGMREWDSPNYLPHTLAPYHNLYDFAEDDEVRGYAKAALDWLYASAALKYYRGGFAGPNSRDYGNANAPLLAPAATWLWVLFGDTPLKPEDPHYDLVHLATSAYRPPLAVVALARKSGWNGAHFLSSQHPPYKIWQPDDTSFSPAYDATVFAGSHHLLGTLRGHGGDTPWDVSPFKLLVNSAERGVDFLVLSSNPPWEHARFLPEDHIVQDYGRVIWMRPAGDKPWHLQAPSSARLEEAGRSWVVHFEDIELHLWPLNLGFHEARPDEKVQQRYPNERWWTLTPHDATRPAGFGIEVWEKANVVRIRERIQRQVPTLDNLRPWERVWKPEGPRVGDAGISFPGRFAMGIAAVGGELTIQENDWAHREGVFSNAGLDGGPPLRQAWLSGKLEVTAGGRRFTGTLRAEGGAYAWREERAPVSGGQ